MTGDYTRWYKNGSVNVTKGSKYVTGTDSNWNTAGLKPGDIFSIDDTKDYEIESITDNTHLVLVKAYEEASANSQKYSIKRQFNATTGAQVAAQATALFADVRDYIDTKQATIRGQSAYELAVKDGYVGNQTQWLASLKGNPGINGTNGKSAYELAVAGGYSGSQNDWLESLKAAGEWSAIKELNPSLAHNLIYRGKNLGPAPTEAQLEAIRNGTFDDLYLGDFWECPNKKIEFSFKDNADVEMTGIAQAWNGATTKMVIADFDYFMMHNRNFNYIYNTGDSSAENTIYEKDVHHVVLVPTSGFLGLSDGSPDAASQGLRYPPATGDYIPCLNRRGQWGPYFSSQARKVMQYILLPYYRECFGEEHLYSWSEYMATKYSGDFVWLKTQIELLSESQVFGYRTVCRDTAVPQSRVEDSQLSLFRINPYERKGNTLLRDQPTTGGGVRIFRGVTCAFTYQADHDSFQVMICLKG